MNPDTQLHLGLRALGDAIAAARQLDITRLVSAAPDQGDHLLALHSALARLDLAEKSTDVEEVSDMDAMERIYAVDCAIAWAEIKP